MSKFGESFESRRTSGEWSDVGWSASKYRIMKAKASRAGAGRKAPARAATPKGRTTNTTKLTTGRIRKPKQEIQKWLEAGRKAKGIPSRRSLAKTDVGVVSVNRLLHKLKHRRYSDGMKRDEESVTSLGWKQFVRAYRARQQAKAPARSRSRNTEQRSKVKLDVKKSCNSKAWTEDSQTTKGDKARTRRARNCDKKKQEKKQGFWDKVLGMFGLDRDYSDSDGENMEKPGHKTHKTKWWLNTPVLSELDYTICRMRRGHITGNTAMFSTAHGRVYVKNIIPSNRLKRDYLSHYTEKCGCRMRYALEKPQVTRNNMVVFRFYFYCCECRNSRQSKYEVRRADNTFPRTMPAPGATRRSSATTRGSTKASSKMRLGQGARIPASLSAGSKVSQRTSAVSTGRKSTPPNERIVWEKPAASTRLGGMSAAKARAATLTRLAAAYKRTCNNNRNQNQQPGLPSESASSEQRSQASKDNLRAPLSQRADTLCPPPSQRADTQNLNLSHSLSDQNSLVSGSDSGSDLTMVWVPRKMLTNSRNMKQVVKKAVLKKSQLRGSKLPGNRKQKAGQGPDKAVVKKRRGERVRGERLGGETWSTVDDSISQQLSTRSSTSTRTLQGSTRTMKDAAHTLMQDHVRLTFMLPNGKVRRQMFQKTDTFRQMADHFSHQLGIRSNKLIFQVLGRPIAPKDTPQGIKHDPALPLECRILRPGEACPQTTAKTAKIYIQFGTKKAVVMRIHLGCSVAQLAERVTKRFGFGKPKRAVQLLLDGRKLARNKTIQQAKICDECTIKVVI